MLTDKTIRIEVALLNKQVRPKTMLISIVSRHTGFSDNISGVSGPNFGDYFGEEEYHILLSKVQIIYLFVLFSISSSDPKYTDVSKNCKRIQQFQDAEV